MTSITLNGVSLIDEANGYFIIVPVDGLEYPTLDVSSYPLSGDNGMRIAAILTRERRIVLRGVLRGGCVDDIYAMRKTIATACLPNQNDDNSVSPVSMRIVTTDNDYTISVYVNKFVAPLIAGTYCEYLIDIIAEDYAIYSTSQTQSTVTKSTGGGLSIPFTIPFSFEGGVDGSVAMTNNGDVLSYPTIVFTGDLTNPRLTNTSSGLFLQINTTINTGEYVAINMKNKTVIRNGSTNLMSSVTSNSSFWGIEPGENVLVLTSGNDNDAGYATVTFKSAYSSI